MADEATTSNPPNSAEAAIQGLQTKLDTELAGIQAQLKAQNEAFQANLQQLTAAFAPKPQPRQTGFTDNDFLDPQAMQGKVQSLAADIANKAIQKNNEMNSVIYNLTQKFPEIQTDQKIKQAVIDAHKTLPESLRDTAAGYELAVNRVITNEGLLPISKRQVTEDAPVASGNKGGGKGRGEQKPKIDDRTLAFAELLGQNVKDPEYLKRLESATQRETWNRYR